MNVWKPVELALTYGARLAWPAFQAVNRQFDFDSRFNRSGRRRRC